MYFSNTDQFPEQQLKPVTFFDGHNIEGFSLDWSSMMPGYLATGDCRQNIFLWKPAESGWMVESQPFQGHSGSVEDIQWSPNESNVLAT